MSAEIVAVCLGPGGIPKAPVEEARVERLGLVGDGHRFHLHGGEDRRVLHVTECCPPFNTGRHPHGRPNRAEPLEPYSKFPNESSKSVRSILPTLGNQ